MTVREQTEQFEEMILAPCACHANAARRDREEPPCPLRTEFQRDRDRILHCSAFRRLKRKTQVFLSPVGDHYRTRLTHTLEVSQIARTIARALRLNEDLTEAIALGHDLGHSPFGHAGEAALNDVCPDGFRHYEQSVRVVEYIEKNGHGLNLTAQVRNGILCHTPPLVADTLEGNVVRVADRIAYINHDIDDALRGGILSESELPDACTSVLGHTKSERITAMISSVIEHGTDSIDMMPDIRQAHDLLHAYLTEHVYMNSAAKTEDAKAKALVKRLYTYFRSNPDALPPEYLAIAKRFSADRGVCDYIAGMSDDYAIQMYQRLFVPRSWDVK